MVPTSPPATPRQGASADEVAAVSSALGARIHMWSHDVAVLLDPRGHRFQRLEWLGDSILDHLTAHHRTVGAMRGARCCVSRDQQELVSDRALARGIRTSGLVALLDWLPSAHRQADQVEASVAAAWRAGGWHSALEAAAVLVHEPLAEDADALLLGVESSLPAPTCASSSFRRLAYLGSYVLEAAASAHLHSAHPGDEGELTARRHPLLAARRLVGVSRPEDGCPSAELSHRLDHVQSGVGLEQLRWGVGRALDLAEGILAPPGE